MSGRSLLPICKIQPQFLIIPELIEGIEGYGKVFQIYISVFSS